MVVNSQENLKKLIQKMTVYPSNLNLYVSPMELELHSMIYAIGKKKLDHSLKALISVMNGVMSFLKKKST